MGGYGSGLNFSQGHFNDPAAGLQAALGAGGMFAQTLKGMDSYNEEQQKLAMLQSDRDRQAKIDFDASQDKAKNLAASSALVNKSSNFDYATDMYKSMADSKKDGYIEERDDSKLNGYNGKTYADIWKGVDTSKLDKNDLSNMQTQIASDSDKSGKYTASNKLSVLKKVNMLNGMSDQDAHANAAKALGLSLDDANSLVKADNLGLEFGKRVEELRHNPLYEQTDAQALRDVVSKYGATAEINASIQSADKAVSAAQQLRRKDIDDKTAMLMTAQDGATKDKLAAEIDILKLQMQNADSPNSRAIAKLSASGSKDSKLTYRDDVNDVIRKYANQYNGAPKEIRNEISSLALELSKKQMSKNQIDAAIADSFGITRGKGKDADVYTYTRSALANQTPDTAAFDAKYGGTNGQSELSVYVANEQKRDALSAKLQDAISSGTGKGNENKIAEIRKELAALQRTPMASAHDSAYLAGKDFMRDFNVGNYADTEVSKQNALDTQAAKDLQTKINKPANGSAVETGAGGTAPVSGSAFDLLKKFTSQGEGTGFKVYMDHEFKNGKTIDRPATYLGVAVVDANTSIDQYNAKNKTNIPHVGSSAGYNPTSEQKGIISSFADNHMKNSLNSAYKYVGDTGNKDTNDLLAAGAANMLHQYGDNSEVAKRLIAKVTASVKSGNGDDAIKTIMGSSYGDAYSDRALAFASAVAAIPSLKTTIKPESLITKYDAKSAAARYSATASGLKKSGLSADDQNQVLANLQSRFAKDNIGLKYNVDPLGMSAGKYTQQPLVSTPQNLQNQYADRIATPSSHDYISYMSPQEVAKVNDPNTRFIDRMSINSDAKSRMGIHETQDKARAIQMEIRNEQLAGDLVTKHGLASQYKNAKTESQKKLIENTAKLMEADAVNADRGASLKAGLFH